ncbi:TPA: tetratricopeptide repeat protein [Candidatus Poribacteria bacterium]|nr:tetratricopeptide repeat protein [Candidatus Poribacteria bacterium]
MIRRGGRLILIISLVILSSACGADEADRNFKKATELRLSGKLEGALALYRKVGQTSEEPLSEHALYHIGEISVGLGRWDEAIAAFKLYLRRYPEGVRRREALLGLGEGYLNTGRFDKVIEVYSSLLRERLNPAMALLRIGRGYEGLGRFREAITYYRRVVEEYPSTLYAESAISRLDELARKGRFHLTRKDLLLQGIALYRSGRYRDARRRFIRIKLKRGDHISTKAIYYTGMSQMGERRYKSAISTFNRLLKSYPYPGYLTSARFRIAQCYRRAVSRREAERRLLGFARRYPWSRWADDALFEAGSIQMEDGRYSAAAYTFRRLASRYGTGRFADDALWLAGWCEYKRRRYSEALQPFRELLRSHPKSRLAAAARYWMARIYERVGNRASALYHYRKLASDDEWYYGVKAREKLRSMGMKAKADPKRSGGLKGRDLKPFPRAARLISLGAYDDAAQELTAMLPGSRSRRVRIYYNLSICYSRMKSHPQSIKYGMYLRGILGDSPDVLKLAYPMPYRREIERWAKAFGLDPNFVAAMAYEESRFNPNAVSPAGAIGLMQIMPSTGRSIAERLGIRRFSSSKLFDPELNIRFGCYYMAQLMRSFKGRIELVAAAYNGGPGRVNGWIKRFGDEEIEEFVEDIPYPETKRHVKKTIATYEIYRSIY